MSCIRNRSTFGMFKHYHPPARPGACANLLPALSPGATLDTVNQTIMNIGEEEMKETSGVSGPVTVVVSRLVKPGREREFEEWLAGITEQMSAFEGFRGHELARPIDGLQQEHVVILRFDSRDHLGRWETSEIRRTWLAKADRFTSRLVAIHQNGGREGLFALGRGNVALGPRKYKMVVVV